MYTVNYYADRGERMEPVSRSFTSKAEAESFAKNSYGDVWINSDFPHEELAEFQASL